jgi:hypothetical protein
MHAECYKESVSNQAQSLNLVYMFRALTCDSRFVVSMFTIDDGFF